VDGLVAQGAPLLETLEQTKNLAARDLHDEEVPTNGSRPAGTKVAPPPDAAMLRELGSWNQMR
jgi:hypothetical protein